MIVPILLGSKSDQEWADKITAGLDKWAVPYKIIVASAHKVPEKVYEIMNEYNEMDGQVVIVTIAGRSNGLSGVCAANSVHPVIACPPHKTKEDFMIDINSSLRMPSDTPVLTVCDPSNVVMAVLRIFGQGNIEMRKKVADRIAEIKESF